MTLSLVAASSVKPSSASVSRHIRWEVGRAVLCAPGAGLSDFAYLLCGGNLRADLLAIPTTREERLVVLNSIRRKLVKISQPHLAWTFLRIATSSLNTKWVGLLRRVSYLVEALRDILNANVVIRWTRLTQFKHERTCGKCVVGGKLAHVRRQLRVVEIPVDV